MNNNYMRKRWNKRAGRYISASFSVLLGVCTLFSLCFLSGCSSSPASDGPTSPEADQTVSHREDLPLVQNNASTIAADDGFYYQTTDGFLRFAAPESQVDILVCSRSNCRHQPWNEQTPLEQRCEAYGLGMGSMNGFTDGEKLYILQAKSEGQEIQYVLQQSGLDRSSMQDVFTFPSRFPSSSAFYNDVFYISTQKDLSTANESGEVQNNGLSEVSFLAYDLKNNTTTTLVEPEELYNANIEVIGSSKDTLFLSKNWLESEWTSLSEFPQDFQTEILKVDLTDNSVTPVLEDLWDDQIYSIFQYGDEIFAMITPEGQNETVQFARLDLDAGSAEVLYESSAYPVLMQDCILMQDPQTGTWNQIFFEDVSRVDSISVNPSQMTVMMAGPWVLVLDEPLQQWDIYTADDFTAGKEPVASTRNDHEA